MAATGNMLQQLQQQQVQQQQQQQQQRRKRLNNSSPGRLHTEFRQVLDAAALQLSMYGSIVMHWPVSSSSRSCLSSSSSELAAAALPAVQLAMLLLEARGSKDAYTRYIIGFVSQLCSCLRPELQDTPSSATHTNSTTEGTARSDASSSSSSSVPCLSPAVQQLLQSEALLRLLAAGQALCAQELHELASKAYGVSSQPGSSSSRVMLAAGGRAAAAADALLCAVLVSWKCKPREVNTAADATANDKGQTASHIGSFESSLGDIAVVVRYVLTNWTGLHGEDSSSDSGSSSGSSSSSGSGDSTGTGSDRLTVPGSAGQQQQQQQLVLSLLQPWALLQLQLLQLVRDLSSQSAGFQALRAMNDAAERMDAAAYAALNRSLVQPMLQLLCNDLDALEHGSCQPLAGSKTAGSSSSSSSSRVVACDDTKKATVGSGNSSSRTDGAASSARGGSSSSGNVTTTGNNAALAPGSSNDGPRCPEQQVCWLLLPMLQGQLGCLPLVVLHVSVQLQHSAALYVSVHVSVHFQ
jgi:hypothetical protein